MMRGVHTFREHQPFAGLGKDDQADLAEFARKVLKRKDGDLAASNHVGIITTKRGTVVEILPKIDLGTGTELGIDEVEATRRLLLRMLCCWHRLGETLPESAIRAMRRFPMLEVFVYRFLADLAALARAGLARRYVPAEENLPHLRGRILFREHIRANIANRARFHVTFDELSIDRPANRLIRTTLTKLLPWAANARNRQSLRELTVVFADVPQSSDVRDDWRRHHIDRSMHHYASVMNWVRLFLFNQGLATYSGLHTNLSLLFPMEQVFEDFIRHSFRRYQNDFIVPRRGPQKSMATIGDSKAFKMKPDILLMCGNHVTFILDAKWKRIDPHDKDPKHGIDQSDIYQLYAYLPIVAAPECTRNENSS